MVQALPPLAVSESVRYLLLSLMTVGYTQSRKTIECPDCHCRYLLLIDAVTCPSYAESTESIEQLAFEYFRAQVTAEHEAGHSRYQISMRVPGFTLPRAV